MALGLLLQVSWICLLLIDGTGGSPAIKGYGYPYTSDSRNMGDDTEEEEVLTSPTFNQNNWQPSYNQPTGPVHPNYNKPTVVQQPDWVPSQQNVPNTPSDPVVGRLIYGASRDWGLENLDKPLVFPLPRDPAKLKPGVVQPQSTSLNVAYTSSRPASLSSGSATHSSPNAYHALSSTSQAAKSPSFESWQPEPVSSGYGVFDTGAPGGNIPHLVYEDVFQYPAENNAPSQSYGAVSNTAGRNGQANYMSKGSSTGYASILEEPSFPSYPTNTGAQPSYPSGMGSFPEGENLNLGQTAYQPHNELSWRQQKPIYTQKVEVSQRVSEPIFPPAQPPSYSVRSRSGYQQGRYRFTQSRYSPEFPSPMSVSLKGVKRPAPSQPTAPKGAKTPQRANW